MTMKQILPSFVKWLLIFTGAYVIVGNIRITHEHTIKGTGYRNDIKIDLENHHKNY